MQRIRNGKLYDTETATCIAATETFEEYQHEHYHAESFFTKTNGECFLLLADHDMFSAEPKFDIKPLDPDEAVAWGERFMTRAEYERCFGPVYE